MGIMQIVFYQVSITSTHDVHQKAKRARLISCSHPEISSECSKARTGYHISRPHVQDSQNRLTFATTLERTSAIGTGP